MHSLEHVVVACPGHGHDNRPSTAARMRGTHQSTLGEFTSSAQPYSILNTGMYFILFTLFFDVCNFSKGVNPIGLSKNNENYY